MNISLRLNFFILGFFLFSALEIFMSYRKRELKRTSRWPHNILIIVFGSILGKMLLPLGLNYVSTYSESKGFGLFNLLDLSYWMELILSICILDLAIYFQHLVSHKNKILWKIHRVHHSDIDLDASTALRFHPIEIVLSLLFKAFLVLIFGFSIESILVFEIILNFMAMFNHSNLYLPQKIEQFLRFIVVTPQMHIVHHSIEKYESDSNYGFNFSFWDKIFKTYTPDFKSGGVIGNKNFRSIDDQKIQNLLRQPFLF